MKSKVETDWVTISKGLEILQEMGVKRTFGCIYYNLIAGNIQSKSFARGKRKQHLVYIPSLRKFGELVLEKEGINVAASGDA